VQVEGKANKKNMQRGKTSRFKVTSGAHVEINDRLFNALRREAPKDRDSAEEMIRSIIVAQKNALEVRPSPAPHHRSLSGHSHDVCLVLCDPLADPRGCNVSSQLLLSRERAARQPLDF
jgi:hypothetical protein